MSEVAERFFRYTAIDTQSREGITDRFPSTEKQKVLGWLLVEELKELHCEGAKMDDHGYVTAYLPSNLNANEAETPVIGLIAHLDTSPEVSGSNVKPIIHRNYRGEAIVLPGDTNQVLRLEENPELREQIGNDIITADGTTLLGADDKAGIAEIMTLLSCLGNDRSIPHGKIAVGFTPDEEVGNGTTYFNIEEFGADVAYTVDGSGEGCIENENFNAYTAAVTIGGVGVHPGYAEGKLVNAMKIAAFFLNELAADPAPETTSGRDGFIHPFQISGGAVQLEMKFLLRDFEKKGIAEKQRRLESVAGNAERAFTGAAVDVTFTESYSNMKDKLEKYPEIMRCALEAVKRAGLSPATGIIRGGTDGARLSAAGLPTPNIFTGGNNFHSKLEWVSVQSMEATVQTLIELVKIWTEKETVARFRQEMNYMAGISH